jgi:hypothetical protein
LARARTGARKVFLKIVFTRRTGGGGRCAGRSTGECPYESWKPGVRTVDER